MADNKKIPAVPMPMFACQFGDCGSYQTYPAHMLRLCDRHWYCDECIGNLPVEEDEDPLDRLNTITLLEYLKKYPRLLIAALEDGAL